MVKVYSYKYDFDQDQCIEKVRKHQERCTESPQYRDYDDDYEGQEDSGSYRYADDYTARDNHILSQKAHK